MIYDPDNGLLTQAALNLESWVFSKPALQESPKCKPYHNLTFGIYFSFRQLGKQSVYKQTQNKAPRLYEDWQ